MKMNEMISMCGLACHNCPAFLATQSNDDAKRAEVAAQWSKDYGSEIKPEDINCDGCVSTSERHFNYCQICEIRKCGTEKEVENCGYCTDYTCDKLDQVFKMAPDAKKRLDGIHSSL
jgi:hypothetical protein